MNMIKKAAAAAALCLGAVTAANAGAITVGGVTWDPDYTDGGDSDFIAEFAFTQWFTTTSSTVSNIVNYNAAVGINAVAASITGGTGATGFFLQGVGEINRVNENVGIGTFTAPTNELTYAFGGIGLNRNGTFDISNAWGRIYLGSATPNYTTPASSQAEVTDAQTGSTWLDLAFIGLGFQNGGVGNGTVSALLAVVGGAAQTSFQPITLSYTADAFFQNNAKYSSGGNGSLVGNTVPEPATLALAGLGLLGAGFASRKRAAK